MSNIIGKAKFKDFSSYTAWHAAVTKEHCQQLWQHTVYNNQRELGKPYENIYPGAFYGVALGWGDAMKRGLKQLSVFNDYLEMTEQSWDVRHVDPEKNIMVISYGQTDEDTKHKNNQFLIENWPEYINYTPFIDYSAIPVAQLRQAMIGGDRGLSGGASLLPRNAGSNLSVVDVRQGISVKQQALNDLKAKVKAVEEGETEDLAPLKKKLEELQEQMKAIQQKKLDELSAMRSELETKVKEMEKQIFILESEIYSIRCFLGETVEFVKLRSGKNAPLSQPVVLYQKMRFMVEDLHKFAIMWPDEPICESVEKSLKTSDKLLDAFAPSNKCITLIRYSETGKIIRAHEERLNCLDTYELIHGNQVAILIRNGENVYCGWTDESKITLKDDFFLKPTGVKTEPMPERRPGESESEYEWRMKRYEAEMEAQNKKNLKEGLSRHFLFSILNGVSAAEDSILPLPKFSNNAERSRHILFSMADGALTDNRFGSFEDIVKQCNATIKKGDMILTTMYLRAEQPKGYGGTAWSNDRGRGEKNRTHDVACQDCTIYPINLVEFDRPRKMMRYRYTYTVPEEVDGVYKQVEKVVIKETDADTKLSNEAEILEYFDYVKQHNFISLEKDYSWWRDSGEPARANFEVWPDEFINLTYMNSCWLNYVLSNKNLGGWHVGGHSVNYEYALKYIGAALTFIRDREKTEAENIRAVGGEAILTNSDWPVALSEWKMEKGVRNITEYQAKRFVKNYLEKQAV